MKTNVAYYSQIVFRTDRLDSTMDRDLVIFREDHRGSRFHQTLTPGERFRKPFFDFTGRYFAYSVSRNRNLTHSTSVACKTPDHLHYFELDITFSFRVADPRLLVESQESDPIRRIADELVRFLSDLVTQHLSWNEIKEGGQAFKTVLGTRAASPHDGHKTTEGHLKEYSRRFGVEIHEIHIERRLPEFEGVADYCLSMQKVVIEELERSPIELKLERLKYKINLEVNKPLAAAHRSKSKTAVHVSTVAPRIARPGVRFLAEVIFHIDNYSIREGETTVIDRKAATVGLRDGAKLRIFLLPLEPDIFDIDDPEGQCEWGPPARRVEFSLQAKKHVANGIYQIRVEIWCEKVQLTRIYWQIEVSSKEAACQAVGTQITRHLPSSAFASYSSIDRLRVAERVASLDAAGIDVFMDCLDLKPADNWREVLEREILSRDALLLFWSHAASRSPWVEKEWRYSLEHRGAEHIIPNALEEPEKCPPPPELKHLHFGSRLMPLVEMRQLGETPKPAP
ncbi:MAG: toll/interleukin-1 receptor domain-containing protein [Thermoanaerobaculia bacterium]|nr:toll/interleukin-1 receptor domain-containing protein [Thermoanaerobaculia bacterium]